MLQGRDEGSPTHCRKNPCENHETGAGRKIKCPLSLLTIFTERTLEEFSFLKKLKQTLARSAILSQLTAPHNEFSVIEDKLE